MGRWRMRGALAALLLGTLAGAARAQSPACDVSCGGAISPLCLESLGAGAAALAPGAGSEDPCRLQLEHYRACLTNAAAKCGATAAPRDPAAGPDPRELLLFQRAEEQRDPALIEAFLAAYPTSTLTPLAERYLKDWAGFTPNRRIYRQAQTRLATLGYYAGPIDGDWSVSAQAAMRAFQRAEGHAPADGALREASLGRLAEGAPAAAGGADPAALADLSAFRDCPTCPEMILVPAGAFLMGSPEQEEGRQAHEGPQRRVAVARFALSKTEINRTQWLLCYEAGGCDALPPSFTRPDAELERLPANSLSRDQIARYLAWLSEKTGRRYRLPTEAEWEYAARAGTQTAYPRGERVTQKQANLTFVGTVPDLNLIAAYPPNPWGFFDMIGNVSEWTAGCWRARADDPEETQDCAKAAIRGGGYLTGPQDARVAARQAIPVDADGLSTIGFRLARDVDPR